MGSATSSADTFDYPSSDCKEGYGGSHTSSEDRARGNHSMNNIDPFEDKTTIGSCLTGGSNYHASHKHLSGKGCPNPWAHGLNNDSKNLVHKAVPDSIYSNIC